MRVSRNYNVEHWKQLKFANEIDWHTAVSIFQDRLHAPSDSRRSVSSISISNITDATRSSTIDC
jgi:hypothetical protein